MRLISLNFINLGHCDVVYKSTYFMISVSNLLNQK